MGRAKLHGEVVGQPSRAHFNLFWRLSAASYCPALPAFAQAELYSYCPTWALSWSYRRQNLVRELVQYNADIMCLQEARVRSARALHASKVVEC